MPRTELADQALLLLVGYGVAAGVMLVLWIVQTRTRDATLVDIAWAANLALLALLYAVAIDDAIPERRALVAGIACVWGLRLAGYLFLHRAHGKPEDGRYAALRQRWGARANRNFFWFFQAQAALDALLSIPFLLALANSSPSLEALEWAGAAIALVGVVGEATADAQLARFKRAGARGKTCREGLWRYSRHPNYFFEVVVWIGFALVALAAPHGWIALFAPVLIFSLIWFVTGIPATEAQAVKTRGADYVDYQRTTSMFVPWFPRRASN